MFIYYDVCNKLSQRNSTSPRVGSDKVIGWTTHQKEHSLVTLEKTDTQPNKGLEENSRDWQA